MSTNFMSLDNNKKVIKETVFTAILGFDLIIEPPNSKPSDFKNVLHIGKDKYYKDVFKCWEDNENDFAIYFGIKGDEFNK